LEELIDMDETCSSGHSERFVNALSYVEGGILINFEAQVIANVAGRINAMVRDLDDVDLKASVSMGMSADASPEDRKIYTEFITTSLEKVRKEMYDEFVTQKYISEADFVKYFETARAQWISDVR